MKLTARNVISDKRRVGIYIVAARQRIAWRPAAATLRALIWLLVWAIGISVLVGCAPAEQMIPCDEDPLCLRYAISADIPVLDPHTSELPEAGVIFRQLYDTLIYRDQDSEQFLPGLAIDWQVSPDGLAYTFQLREEIVFHDGSSFTASAVAQNVERIFHPESDASLARELLGPLQRIEILEDYRIRLHLFEPYAALLDGLAQPFLGIASPVALGRFDGLRYQYHQSGTGPFILDDYLPGDSIILRRFDGYKVHPDVYEPLVGTEINRIEISIVRDIDANPLSSPRRRA